MGGAVQDALSAPATQARRNVAMRRPYAPCAGEVIDDTP